MPMFMFEFFAITIMIYIMFVIVVTMFGSIFQSQKAYSFMFKFFLVLFGMCWVMCTVVLIREYI